MDISDLLAGVDTGTGLAALAGVLVVLALVDSTSFGTLLVPVWLLLAPGRPRPGRMLVYLATVAGSYLAVGLAIMAGAGAVVERWGDAFGSRPALVLRLLLGIGLFALSFRFDRKRTERRRAQAQTRAAATGTAAAPGRLARWRDRAVGAAGTEPDGAVLGTRTTLLSLVGLALAAVSIEVATMLPYLAAIGILSAADLGTATSVGVLAGYCVVMVAPALLLLGGRLVAARRVEPLLRRLEGWLSRYADEMTGWVLGVVGVLLALHAARGLGILG